MNNRTITSNEKFFRKEAAKNLFEYRALKRSGGTSNDYGQGIAWGLYCGYRAAAMKLAIDRDDYEKYL